MKLRIMTAAIVVFATITVFAQNGSPAVPARSAAYPRSVIANNNNAGLAENARAQSAMHVRVEEMGNTLTRMHALLKQMQVKAAAGSSKDPMEKANLEMWGLMLGDLDKQYAQLRLASHAHEDMESRRAAMYKQAEERAAATAKVAHGQGGAQGAPASAAVSSPAAASQNAAEPAAQQTRAPAPAASSPN